MNFYVLQDEDGNYYGPGGPNADPYKAYRYYLRQNAEDALRNSGKRIGLAFAIVEMEEIPYKGDPTEELMLRARIDKQQGQIARARHEMTELHRTIAQHKQTLKMMGYVWGWEREKSPISRETYEKLVKYVKDVGWLLFKDHPDLGMKIDAEETTLRSLEMIRNSANIHYQNMWKAKKRAKAWKALAKRYRGK